MSVSSLTKNKPSSFRHWQHLQILLSRSPLNSDFLLKHPAPVVPPPGFNVEQLFRSCSNGRASLLYRHILSCLALGDELSAEIETIIDNIGVRQIFPSLARQTFFSASWISVPVPVTSGSSAKLLYLMFGLAEGDGTIHLQDRPNLAQSSRQALEQLFHSPFLDGIARDKDLLVWTLQKPTESSLTGSSLGLPAALGLHLLNKGKQWPRGLFASGEMSRQGRIIPVKNIREKAKALSKVLRLFIVPEDGHHIENNAKRVPAQTFTDALFALNCFVDGVHDGKSIILFRLAASDPNILLGQFDELPAQFFRLYDLATVLQKIKENGGIYLSRLATCLRKNSYDHDRVIPLARLFSCDELLQFAAADEFAALKYCFGMLALYNHSGNIVKSREWSGCAEKIAGSVSARKEISCLVNNDFVSERFNRYDFRTDLPSAFADCLEHEEKIQALQQDDNWQLGALYGTLAQHYGFCGSAYFNQLRQTAEKAIAAFGRKYRSEALRIQSYIIYGLLDCGNYAEAHSVLCSSLDLPENVDIVEWPKAITEKQKSDPQNFKYQTALISRFYSEQPDLLQGQSPVALINTTLQHNHHPWQLTATNLGRYCMYNDDQELAMQLLKHAISICMENGETMQIMALLPLSVLHLSGDVSKSEYHLAERIIEMIRSGNTVDKTHFMELFSCCNGQEILSVTSKLKKFLFPFSYR